jgi:uncharacterized membrane protein YdjX (TVP38/TMEM64 family)/MoaA/NifB/PqqE/SkfB family radical SAM enzyme/SAM-dependent methyltransferase
MFSCRPGARDELETAQAQCVVDQARDLGARVFYFTGGEPTLHPGFFELARRILSWPDAHLVVLTNALTAKRLTREASDWPGGRVHFQVSVDGSEEAHNALRGQGAFERMTRDVEVLRDAGFAVNFAMTVHRENLSDMPGVVDLAARLGLPGVHYLWLFGRGQAGRELMAEPEEIWPALREAADRAEAGDVRIDNIEILRRQVFSLPGTRLDLSNAGWESLAVGPDGQVYPSPALVLDPQVRCGYIRQGLEKIWRTSGILEKLRAASLVDARDGREDPLRFLTGGGDVDHSFLHGGRFVGHDPYQELYRRIALWLIAREAKRFQTPPSAHVRLAMGDYLHQCPEGSKGLMFTHSNCVLSLAGRDGHDLVGQFYSAAAASRNEDIANPVQYESEETDFIPAPARVRSYGCGSPVADADLRAGQTVVDLGCGAGMEVFLAARAVGPEGLAIGIDMLEPMLARARLAAGQVAREIGFANTRFHQAFLEELPLADASVDVVVSNCVINLCPHKRKAFSEIFRILRPGGKLVVSDVTSQDDIPLAVQYDEKMRGECLGGAFRLDRLFDLLGDVGLTQARILKRFPYRQVQGHRFYSLTYSAVRPIDQMQNVMYRGPFEAVVTEDGRLVRRGEIVRMPWQADAPGGDAVFVLDEQGRVTNIAQQTSCPCGEDPDAGQAGDSCCGEGEQETPEELDSSCCCDGDARVGAMRRGGMIALVASVAALGVLGLVFRGRLENWLGAFVVWTQDLGAIGAVVFAAFYVLATVLMFPGSILTLGAGLLFGLLWGTVVISFAATAAAAATFLIGRFLARDWVAQRIAGSRRFAALDQAVSREGFKIVLLTRLSPVFPFSLLNYGYSITGVSFCRYVLASWIGMLPGTLMYVYFGTLARNAAAIAAGREMTAADYIFYALGFLVTVVVVFLVTRRARRALAEELPAPAGAGEQKQPQE